MNNVPVLDTFEWTKEESIKSETNETIYIRNKCTQSDEQGVHFTDKQNIWESNQH